MAVSFGGWKPPIRTAEIIQKPLVKFGGLIPRPGRGILTAVSPKMVKPREKPRAFSNGDLRVKIGTHGACVDVSEQQWETNYKTHEHTKNIEQQCASVTCDKKRECTQSKYTK